ncbi:MAG: chemotaxis protein CheW [Candidatus Latescibacterota bacterium]
MNKIPETGRGNGKRCFKDIGVFGRSVCPRLQEYSHCRLCPEYLLAGRDLFERPAPAGWLEEWTESFAGEKAPEPAGTVAVVVCRVGEEWLALAAIRFLRIMNLRHIHTIPFRSGPVVLGLANIDGELVPCMSLSHIIGLPGAERGDGSPGSRLALVELKGERFALLADEIMEVRRVVPSEIGGAPSTVSKSASGLTVGVFSIGTKTVGLLDEDKLFTILRGSLRL